MSRNSKDICHCEPFSQELIAELKLNSLGCTSLKVVHRSQGQEVEQLTAVYIYIYKEKSDNNRNRKKIILFNLHIKNKQIKNK